MRFSIGNLDAANQLLFPTRNEKYKNLLFEPDFQKEIHLAFFTVTVGNHLISRQ